MAESNMTVSTTYNLNKIDNNNFVLKIKIIESLKTKGIEFVHKEKILLKRKVAFFKATKLFMDVFILMNILKAKFFLFSILLKIVI